MAATDLTAARLRELLHYDPETGLFTNLTWRSSRAAAGSIAGYMRPDGYLRIRLDSTPYLAHRLAWLYMTGEWPQRHIDHANGDPSDNRIANLRDVTRSVNLQNRRTADRDSTSGYLGVCKLGNRWKAQITVRGKNVNLGRFDTAEEAHAVYLAAKRVHHPGGTL